MTATILLIRHAAHEQLGTLLSGRSPGLALGEAGRAQAAALGRRFAAAPPDLVQASPIERAEQTARAIGGAAVETVAALTEIDFGSWTGRSFAELEGDPAWRLWNERRGSARAPGGESMAEAQARAVAHVEATAAAQAKRSVAMVSHCDIIRAVIAHYLGLPLDNLLRFDIDPASVSVLLVGAWGGRVLSLNEKVGA